MAVGVLDRQRAGGMRADAPVALDKHLELIVVVEMRRRHCARRLDDQEALRQAVVVDLVAVHIDAMLGRRANIFGKRVVAPVDVHLA